MIGSSEKARAGIYRQLASVERAGVPILRSMQRMAQKGAGRRMLGPVLDRLNDGIDIGSAFKDAPGFSRLETAVIAAGAAGGTLPNSFTQLAEHFEERAMIKLKLAGSLAYPLLVIHLAVFLPSLATLFKDRGGGLAVYLSETLLPLLGVYAVIGALVVGFKAMGKSQPRVVDRLLMSIPVVGGIVRKTSLAIGLKALSILYANGVPLLRALELSAETCPNRIVGDLFNRASDRVGEGLELPEALAEEPELVPPVILDLVSTGATSGQLDDMLDRACSLMDEEARQARTALLWVLSGIVFLAAAGCLAGLRPVSVRRRWPWEEARAGSWVGISDERGGDVVGEAIAKRGAGLAQPGRSPTTPPPTTTAAFTETGRRPGASPRRRRVGTPAPADVMPTTNVLPPPPAPADVLRRRPPSTTCGRGRHHQRDADAPSLPT